MAMTRTFKDVRSHIAVTATRTTERALILTPDRTDIVYRNIWMGDNGKRYVQYKGKFRLATKSDEVTHDYRAWWL